MAAGTLDEVTKIEEMINKMGDLSKDSTRVKEAKDKYDNVLNDFDTYLNAELSLTPTDTLSMKEKVNQFCEKYRYDGEKRDEFSGKLEDRVAGLEKVRGIAQKILDEQAELIKKNKEIISKWNDKYIEDTQKIDDLQNEINELTNEVGQKEATVNILDTQIKSKKDEIKKLEEDTKKILTGDDGKSGIEGDISKLTKKKRQAIKHKGEIESKIEAKNGEIEKTTAKIKEIEDKIESLKTELEIAYNSTGDNKDRIDSIRDEMDSLGNEKRTLIDKNSNSNKEIASLNGDLDVEKANIKDFEIRINDKKNEKAEIESNTKTKKDELNDEIINMTSKRNQAEIEKKQSEESLNKKSKQKKDLVDANNERKNNIDELSNKNKDLEEHLEKNYQEFKVNLKEVKLDNPQVDAQAEQQNQGSQEQGGVGGNSQGGGGVPANGNQSQALINEADTPEEIAKKMLKNLIEARTLEERRKLLNGEGYKYIAETARNLKGADRRKMYAFAREARNDLKVPEKDEFENQLDELNNLLRDEDKIDVSCYKLLFKDGKPRNFRGILNSMSTQELRDVKHVVDTLKENRELIGKNNPELLEYFDKNYLQFIQTTSIMEKASRKGPFRAIRDNFGGRKNAVCEDLTGSMKGYTEAKYEDEKKLRQLKNNAFSQLGLEDEVVSVEDSLNSRGIDEVHGMENLRNDRARQQSQSR